MSFNVCTMTIWLLCSPSCIHDVLWYLHNSNLTAVFSPFCSLYVISFDVSGVSILTAVFSPLLQFVRDPSAECLITIDLTASLSPLLQTVRYLSLCLQIVDLTSAFSPSCRPCVISCYVCTMSTWLLCAHRPTARAWSLFFMSAGCRPDCCILSSCRPCVISLLMSAQCRSNCCVLATPKESTWSLF